MNWNQALFPSLKGGVDARSRKCREATLVRADGVVSSAKLFRLKDFAELTTPSAALRRLRAFLLMPQPPLLFKEGNVSALKQSANSFTRSETRGLDFKLIDPDDAVSVHAQHNHVLLGLCRSRWGLLRNIE